MRKIERSVAIQATTAEVLEVIRDYESYSFWMPHVTGSRIVAKEGDITVGEFEYSGRKDCKCTLEFIDDSVSSIRYVPSGEPGSPGIRGEWELKESLPPGHVVLIGRVFELRGCSFLSGILARRVLSNILAAMLYSVRDRVAFRRASDEALLDWSDLQDEGVEKLLRIVQDSNGGLRMWFRGKKYELRPLP